MSTNVGIIDLSLILNSDKFSSQLKNIDGQAKKASSTISASLSKIGKAVAVAFSVTKIVQFGKECLNVATETSNAWIGLNSILTGQGKSFDQAKKFINDYISDGLVPLNNAVTAYKNLAARGYSSDQIQKTMTALKNSATFGRQSTYSLGEAVQTASEGLKNENSILVDNAGVTKNVSKMWDDYAKSIGKTRNQLTQQEKIQAEVNGILEETKFQSNDATIYTNTYSGKVAQLSQAFTTMKTAIGNAIQPLAKLFIPIITSAVNVVTKLFTALSGLFSLFGLKADSVETVSSGIGDIADSASDASGAISGIGDSAKKSAKDLKSLASFDTAQVLQSNSDDSSSSGSGAGGSSSSIVDSLDVSSTVTEDTSAFNGLIDRVKELANIFKEGFEISFGDTNFDGIIGHLTNIKNTIIDIWTDSDVLNSANQWIDTMLFSLGQAVGSVARIGVNITEGLLGSIDQYLSQNIDRIKKHICNMFEISSKDIALTGNLWQALGEISDVFSGDTAKQIGANIIAMFANPFMSAIELSSKFVADLRAVFVQPIIDNVNKIKEAIENTLQPIQTVTGTLAECFSQIGDKWNEVYDTHISPLMESLKVGLSDTFGKFLDIYNEYVAPTLQNMADKFNEVWENSIQPLFEKLAELCGKVADLILVLWNTILKPVVDWFVQTIIPVLVPIFESIWNTICDIFADISNTISGVIEVFSGLIDFIIGVFTGDWNRAWEGIKTFFTGIWNTISNFCKIIADTILLVIKTWVANIAIQFSIMASKLKAILEAIKTVVINIWNGIWSIIKNVINKIIGGIESFVNGTIKGINKLLSGISKVANAIGDLIGLNPISLQLSTISLPKLAQGGYVKANTPQLAIIGDNKTQGEIVAPEDKIMDLYKKANQEMGLGNNPKVIELLENIIQILINLSFDFNLYIDSYELNKRLEKIKNKNKFATNGG